MNKEYVNLHFDLTKHYLNEVMYPLKTFCGIDCKYLYVLYCPLTKLTKIGITNNVRGRLRKLSCSIGSDVVTLLVLECQVGVDEKPKDLEAYLHNYFKGKRKCGEWFDLNIKDLIKIRQFIYAIEGEDVIDNLSSYYCNG